MLRVYWRWISIVLLGVALNYVVNKVLDLRYGARSSFDFQEVVMAILFSYAILEGSRWIRNKLHTIQKQIANTPLSLFTYPIIFLYITFIILGVGHLMNIVFFGGANQGDENFIVLLLTLFFSFPVLAIDYLWKYKVQLEEVNDQLQNKQEELIQFRKDNHSKIIIEASHGVHKVLVTPDQILMIYRESTIVYIVNREYKKLIANHSLDALEELLPSNGFCRANRQFILTPDIIQSIKSGSYGKIELQLASNNNLPVVVTVSRPSAAGFRRWLSASTKALA
ncbi:MAG: LytTR family DNA-binding domain-containing protein [Cyclobacteriaceae bacterium]